MKRILLALLLLLGSTVPSVAKNVDLVTLPKRDSVELTIYNTEDITLAKETRYVTLKKGANQLQFSWAGTLIDPTSVEIRPLDHADEIEIADTVFPGQKPQCLYWNIDSEFEGQVKVEVSYFTSGLTWRMDYVAITDKDEETMDFRGYIRVFNHSGEEYENASVRLIVGKINLVEKIADLARRRGIAVPSPTKKSGKYKELRRRSVLGSISLAEACDDSGAVAGKKDIVKEGLSEYFLFTVSGQETIKNGWSKRMQAVHAEGVKFDILYRMRAYQYGPRPVRFFIWQNDDEHKLGDSPLPDGQVRIFRENGRDGLSFLGQQIIRYVPIKAKIEVNLGPDDLVNYKSARQGTKRNNFLFHHGCVVGWDAEVRWVDTIRNYRTKPIRFELRRIWPGHVEYSSETTTTLFDYRTTETTFDIPARGKTLYPATVITRHGTRCKQNRIDLK